MFKDITLSKKEQAMFDLRKKQLQIALETKTNKKDTETYKLPEMYDDDEGGMIDVKKRHDALYKRYEDVKEDLREEEIWESEQVKKSKVQFRTDAEREAALAKK